MKRIFVFAFLWFAAISAIAQNPQTQNAPIFAANAKYVQGTGFGYAPTLGSGLILNLASGTPAYSCSTSPYAGGTLSMTASITNYVYLNTAASCIPAVKTTAFTTSDIPIAIVVASSSSITAITDYRAEMSMPSSSGLACLTGDISAGSGGSCTTSTLPNINGSPGSYTNANITVNGKGQVTSASNGTGGGATAAIGPCDILAAASTPCVAAHSVTRRMLAAYTGNLFELERTSDSTTLEVGTLASGLVNMQPTYAFCGGTTCKYSIIYDQMGTPSVGNNLPQLTSANQATLGFVSFSGYQLPIVSTVAGLYYRNRTSTVGIPTGNSAITEFMIYANDKVHFSNCCGTYGDTESNISVIHNGHMFALANSTGDFGTTGSGPGPWPGVDFEGGTFLYGATPPENYVNVLAKYNPSGTTWTLKAGDATTGTLTTLNTGAPPFTVDLEGGLSLGEGGDASSAPVSFLEGVVVAAVTTDATDSAIQQNVTSFYNSPFCANCIVTQSILSQNITPAANVPALIAHAYPTGTADAFEIYNSTNNPTMAVNTNGTVQLLGSDCTTISGDGGNGGCVRGNGSEGDLILTGTLGARVDVYTQGQGINLVAGIAGGDSGYSVQSVDSMVNNTVAANGDVACLVTGSFNVTDCPVGAENIFGVQRLNRGNSLVVTSGFIAVNLDASQASVTGDIVCMSATTSGFAHDNGNTPCFTAQVGFVVENQSSRTTALIAISPLPAKTGDFLYSVAGTPLPSCTSALNGLSLKVSDATSPLYMTLYTGSGTSFSATPVICNGATSSWLTY